jgi:aquaporin Z
MEAAELGLFMILASSFATLLYAPSSPVPTWIPHATVRDVLMGLAMGSSAITIIYSPLGKRSGAHFNPAVTLAFFRLGKLHPWDALFYILFQFLGGVTGIILAALLLQDPFTNPPIDYIITIPGLPGLGGQVAALITEILLAFTLMMTVLIVSNHSRLHHYTGIFAGLLVATFITVAARISGMSINPARTFASALPANVWTAFWIYFSAPPVAMILAVDIYLRRTRRDPKKLCGKLCPNTETPCICSTCCCMDDSTLN